MIGMSAISNERRSDGSRPLALPRRLLSLTLPTPVPSLNAVFKLGHWGRNSLKRKIQAEVARAIALKSRASESG